MKVTRPGTEATPAEQGAKVEQTGPEPTRAEQTKPEPTRAKQTRPEPNRAETDETGDHQG